MALTKIDDRGLKTPIDLQDNEKIRLGTGNDLELYHDGSHSRIVDSGTGDFVLQGSAIYLNKADNSENMLTAISDGAVELYHNGSKKLETTSSGVTVTGTLEATTYIAVPDQIYHVGDADTAIRFPAADTIALETAGSERLRVDSSGNLLFNGNGVVSVQSNSSNLYLGGGSNQPSEAYLESGSFTGFKVNGSEKARFDSSGNLLIGKTSTSFSTDGLRVDGTGLIAASRSSTSTNGGTANGASLSLCNPSATDNNFSNVGFYKADGLVTSQINGITTSQSNRHGALSFLTHDGSVLSEKMNIDHNGDIVIGTSSWSYKKPLNVQGSSGAILALSNYDTTSYAADTHTSIEMRVNTGNTGNQNGSCEIRAFKENGTNGNNARGLGFYTAGNGGSPAERMRIDSDGYVLKPYQPAFRAGRQGTDLDVNSGDAIVFNAASGSSKHFNTGSHYNTSNGRFTAPVAGVYHFYALVIWEGLADNTNMTDSFDFYVNNSQRGYSSRRAYYDASSTGDSGYYTDHATMTIELAKDDYVWCRNKFNSKRIHNNDTYCTFQGFLIG